MAYPGSGQHVTPEREDLVGAKALYVGCDNILELDLDLEDTGIYDVSDVVTWYAVIKEKPDDDDDDAISTGTVTVDAATSGQITIVWPRADFVPSVAGSAWWSLHAEGTTQRIPLIWGKVEIKEQATTA